MTAALTLDVILVIALVGFLVSGLRRGLARSLGSMLGLAAGAVREMDLSEVHEGDTTHLDAVDREGNMVAATPGLDRMPAPTTLTRAME